LYSSNILNLSAKDLYPTDFIQNVGKKVYFRAVSCYENGTYLSISQGGFFLTIVASAPHITNSVVAQTRCFDTTDGSVTLTFDRELYAGEVFVPLLSDTLWGNTVEINGLDTLSGAGENLVLQIKGIAAGTYRLNFYANMNGENSYTDAATHTLVFTISNPTPVEFSATSTEVNCYEGADGSVTLTAWGGKGGYSCTMDGGATWIAFSGTTATISGLSAGNYSFKVKDQNDCIAKENGNEKTLNIEITQPASAIGLSEIEIKEPTGFGLTNGYISVRVTGGTPNDDNSYFYEWRKGTATGTVITSDIITDAVNNPFTILLNNIGKGTYFLTVKDKNYAGATSNLDSCGIIAYSFEVNQPDLLVANISLEKCISCNIANEYEYKSDRNANDIPDEAEDAVVKVKAQGGIVGSYTYQWQRLNGANYENIPNATDTLLAGLTEGTYKIIVTDANNNTADAALFVPFPAQLQVSLSAIDVQCNDGFAGQVSANATGGRGDYTYEWNTMDTIPTVSRLAAGRYFVFVRDSANCAVKGSVEVKQPDGLQITDISVENPLCTSAENGKINVQVSGGEQPYSLVWSNGMAGENITGLGAGTYALTFTDANQCSVYKEYTLTDPEPFGFELGGDVTLCLGDSIMYDMTIDDEGAAYNWTKSGETVSNLPIFTIKDAGIYILNITTSNGCAASDYVEISQSEAVLTPEFLLTTYAYTLDTVVLVNTSPTPPERVEWVIPADNSILIASETPEYLELIFLNEGSYDFGLRGYEGECAKTFTKTVVVENNVYGIPEKLDTLSNIKAFSVAPNPNNGQYTVTVELYEDAPVMIRVVSMMQQEPYPAVNQSAAKYFSVPFSNPLTAGVYLVILQTSEEVRTFKMIVQ
ncbi:MAG: T9SS type A sorting domain-containing protein, partial [Prevotellaceae bacterium]|jgi:hypothetical protein|nr:T9SS type A sorting domain-containing protein [Prevotellaceae bacterium]